MNNKDRTALSSASDIRKEFLDYFSANEHEVVKSSPLVPRNDPSLMFTNAGMVQFKNVFTGTEKRANSRACSAQKCIRAGGKHNDLDNVGYTARHHTFFEMLGNFSFGDYFKEEAIFYAWEFVHKTLGLPKENLLVTVYSEDEQAATFWKKIAGFNDDKIIRIPTDDNFWMMGDTGPCGPCSEIFIDQGESLAGGPPGSPDEDGDRFLEFWNLVFMQFEQEPDGNGGYIRKPLPKPSIDTGMGLERMSAIIAGKKSNYDIDYLRNIIEHSADITGVSPDGEFAASHRVIADHLRAVTFLIADGVMPSNEGRGYVLRRIMRRGMRHAYLLGAKEALMYKLVPTLNEMMGSAYPEIIRASDLVVETLKIEEERFRNMLGRGLGLLEDEVEQLGDKKVLSGEVAFKLYDTFGFPVDLTADALKSKNISIDMKEYDECMARQKAEARKNWAGSGEASTDKLWFDIIDKFGATDFMGYENEEAEATIQAIIKDGKAVDCADTGDNIQIVVNQSPFYAESGGQVGDTGTIGATLSASGDCDDFYVMVCDTKKIAGKIWVHEGKVAKGKVKVGADIHMAIDAKRRRAIRANHSATHLLHAALHRVIGTHVTQKGSLVSEERLRFDVSLNKALSEEQKTEIETMVNEQIWKNAPVMTRLMNIEDAMEAGAMALFGEKYDDEVRVLFMGEQDQENRCYSVELCGGTHVRMSGDIGIFKIVGDSALSAGVRRIEAVTRRNALELLREEEEILNEISRKVNFPFKELPVRISSLVEEKRKLEKQVAELRKQLASGQSGGNKDNKVKDVGGISFVCKILEDFPAKDLKSMADEIKREIKSGVVALISAEGKKASIVVAVTDDLCKRINAVDLVREGATCLGGKGGGGRPDMAQAGGSEPESAQKAIDAIERFIENADFGK